MQLSWVDWAWVAGYFLLNLLIGLYYSARAGKDTSEFFVGGRNVSWWLAGTSMVAATFAADTPLAVTGLVAKGGVAGNWLWWNMVAGGMLTVFVYARLWRRAGVVTDIEFIELRYGGKAAAFLRGFKAIYLGIPINCIVLGWVNLAIVEILELTLGMDKIHALGVCMAVLFVTAFITTLSGLWGVLVTDFIQFFIKMTMVIVLAYYVVMHFGGMSGLVAQLAQVDAARHAQGQAGSVLAFVPDLHSAWMPAITFCVYIAVNWWATWYPGAEPGGGGYVAQRMFCARDERHSLLATLWFNVAHYALRAWPWILVALASLVLYPGLKQPETGYVKAMIDFLPASMRGLMIAAFAAAYMSTVATQLNWGASYIINDFYRRFIKPEADESQYVLASKIVTLLLMVCSGIVTYYLDSISQAWKIVMVTGAGTGTVLILRWLWWRINAWSEVSSLIIAAAVSLFLQLGLKWDSDDPVQFAYIMLITVGATTVGWLLVTFLTPPEKDGKLVDFYRRTRPSLVGWRPVARLAPDVVPEQDGVRNVGDWIAGCILIYGALFGVGKILFMQYGTGLAFLAMGAAAGVWIYRDLTTRGWKTIFE